MIVFYTYASLLWAEPQGSSLPSQNSSSKILFPREGSTFWFILDPDPWTGIAGNFTTLKVHDTSICLQYEGGGKTISDFTANGCIDCSNKTNTLTWNWSYSDLSDDSLSSSLIEVSCNGHLHSKFEDYLDFKEFGYKRESKCDYHLIGACGYSALSDCTYNTFEKKLTKVEYTMEVFENVKSNCTWTSSKHYCVYENGTVVNFPTEQDSPWCIKGEGCMIEMCPYISGRDLKP